MYILPQTRDATFCEGHAGIHSKPDNWRDVATVPWWSGAQSGDIRRFTPLSRRVLK